TYKNGILDTMTRAKGQVAAEHKTSYVRDDFGNVTDIIEEVASGEPSRTTTMTYDADHVFVKSITNAKNQTTELRFDKRFGTPKTITAPNGMDVRRGYDGFGRLVEMRDPTGTTVVTFSPASRQGRDTPVGHVEPRIEVSVEREGTLGTRSGSSFREFDNYGRL